MFDARNGTFAPQELADVGATVHWSPNRARLAAPCRDPDRWLLADFTTGRPATREIRLPGGTELSVSWAPDASSIVFLSKGAHPPYRSYWLDLRGRPQEPVALGVASEALGHVCQWSEDSRGVVCNGGSERGERGLYLVALDGEVPVVRRLSGTDETGRAWCFTSADWVVFQTRHSGLLQAVRTDAAPGSEAITLHHAPLWNWAAHQRHVTRTGACGDGQRVGLCLGELSESGFRERLLVEGELSAPSWSMTGGLIRVRGTIGTQSGQWLIDPEEHVPTPILLGREGSGVVSISQDLSFVVANDERGAPMLYLATGKREPLYLPGEGLLRSLSLSPSSDAIAALRLPPGSTRETELLVRSVRGSSLGAWIAAKLPANPPSTVVWQPRSGDLGRTPAESYPWCNPRVVRIAGG